MRASFVLAAVLLAGCSCGTKKNPAYQGDGGPDADTDVDTDSDGDSDTDTDSDSDSDTNPPPECEDATDCPPIYGAAPCGAWECNASQCEVNCPGCTDVDRDGYGPEAGACAGGDCDDDDDAIFDSVAPQACYSGPAGTSGTGTCRDGTQSCGAGVWTPCVGEVVPSGEACNTEDDDCDGSADEDLGDFGCGIGACATSVSACAAGAVGVCVPLPPGVDNDCDGVDDDCDGAIDEGCSANCLWVWTGGNDGTADGSPGLPYRNIQTAIDAADAAVPEQVCVAGDNDGDCSDNANFAEAITMRDGISVYGGYQSLGSAARCGWTVRITPGVDVGVSFDATVVSPTVLDGFQVDRANTATSAGITVDGSTGVILSNVYVPDGGGAANVDTFGVDLRNGAEATITGSSIYAGLGTGLQVGVRSVGSIPTITKNCRDIDVNGRCDDFCGTDLAIRGRFTAGGGETYAVLLQDSPNASVDSTAMCGNDGDNGAGIKVTGDSDGIVIRGNLVNAWGGLNDSHGIWLEDCDGDAPWIVSNYAIYSAGDNDLTRVDGIRSIGDCHPVIDSNLLISGGGEGGSVGANGVYCGANASGASQCVVLGNASILGSSFGFPPSAVGVRCDDDACMRIADNVISGNAGVDVTGVWLQRSGTFVDDNDITGGCATSSATGVYSDDSFARIQNNRIRGGGCGGGGGAAATFRGLHVVTAAGVNEVDVHSNTIDGGGNAIACSSYGVTLDVDAVSPPAGGVGIFRNDVIRGGECTTASYVFNEADVAADPRIFESIDLDPYSSPTGLYYDADTGNLGNAAGVNALVDMTVSSVLDQDALFVGYPIDLHLQAGSPCNGTGTSAGAPATDMDGNARDAATPDIGADEVL